MPVALCDPPHLNWGRVNAGALVLLDGSIVVENGKRKPDPSKQPCDAECLEHSPPLGNCDEPEGTGDPESPLVCFPARKPERYTPPEVFESMTHAENVWTFMAPAAHVRQYHQVWGLTPSGTVFVGGSTYGHEAGDQHDARYSVEIWSPPYFFNGPRPEILEYPDDVVHYGEIHDLHVKTAGGLPVDRVAILRNSSVTHATDFQQAYVELLIAEAPTLLPGDTWLVRVQFPDHSWLTDPQSVPQDGWAIAPPGWYMLTAVDEFDRPSEAVWVQLWPPPTE